MAVSLLFLFACRLFQSVTLFNCGTCVHTQSYILKISRMLFIFCKWLQFFSASINVTKTQKIRKPDVVKLSINSQKNGQLFLYSKMR